jgi:hypothetical protein
MRDNVSEPLDWASAGRVLPERNMRSHLVIINGIWRKDSAKVLRVQRDQMIRALAPDRPDQALSMSVLPGRAERGGSVPDAHCSYSSLERAAKCSVNMLLQEKEKGGNITDELHRINAKLDALGLAYQSRDPDYDAYLRALHEIRIEKQETYTPAEIEAQDKFIRSIIAKLQ